MTKDETEATLQSMLDLWREMTKEEQDEFLRLAREAGDGPIIIPTKETN